MSHLDAADSLLDLARRLGAACLEREDELAEIGEQPRSAEWLKLLEEWTGDVSAAAWEEAIEDPGGFERQFGLHVTRLLKQARTRYPLDCLGVLRGLCRQPLGELFETITDQIELMRGLPVPFATRPIPDVIGGSCTTSLKTLNNTNLLEPWPFDLYGPPDGGQVRVLLDYAHRDRLDELTWDTDTGLPLIATLHPDGGGDLDVTIDGDRFFDVRPRRWDPAAIEALLERAREAGAQLAVLPELSLPAPDALEAMIARKPENFPPIVVAGSAHVTEAIRGRPSVRANESRLYLDGRFVAMARKHHEYKTEIPEAAGGEPGKTYSEDLTRKQTTIMVLSGQRTRLAVVICADLQEAKIPSLLVAAGVNLLLVPTMTQKVGSFNGSASGIASYCQGVTAMVNTRWGDDGKPFLCFCAVPREDPAEQSAALPRNGQTPVAVLGLFDPNQPLPDAVSWL